jgi:hypothetical protein
MTEKDTLPPEATPKPKVKLFICYAHADMVLKEKLTGALQTHLDLSKAFDFERWHDLYIQPGDDWNAEIEKALQNSDAGLILLSPHLLGSAFIKSIEIPALLNAPLGVIPVMLKPLDFSMMDLGEFNRLQVFRHNQQAFSQMQGQTKQDDFVMALFKSIVTVTAKRLAGA